MSEVGKTLELSISVGDATFHANGPSDLVMKALTEFDKLASTKDRRAPVDATRETDSGQKPSKPTHSRGNDVGGEKIPFAVFMQRAFINQPARATAIVTWAKRFDGKATLKPNEIESYWKRSTAKKPANAPAVCKNAEKRGWLENKGGGSYAVTGHGESMVDALKQSTSK